MSKRTYEELKDILCHELNEITRKGDIDRERLDDVYKLTSAITMVESLMNRQSEEEGGYSNTYMNEGGSNAYRRSMRNSYDGMYNRMGNSRDYSNRSYPPIRVGRYSMDDYWDGSNDYSEARGRDAATGRYVSRDNYDPGYSRHTAEEKVTHKLEDMLDTTQDQRIRDAIMTAITMLR